MGFFNMAWTKLFDLAQSSELILFSLSVIISNLLKHCISGPHPVSQDINLNIFTAIPTSHFWECPTPPLTCNIDSVITCTLVLLSYPCQPSIFVCFVSNLGLLSMFIHVPETDTLWLGSSYFSAQKKCAITKQCWLLHHVSLVISCDCLIYGNGLTPWVKTVLHQVVASNLNLFSYKLI